MFVLGNLVTAAANLIGVLINLWSFVIVVSAILSWVPIDPYNQLVRIIRRLADVLCDPIRRLVPMAGLGIDLSPLLAILVLQFTNQFLVRSLFELGARLG